MPLANKATPRVLLSGTDVLLVKSSAVPLARMDKQRLFTTADALNDHRVSWLNTQIILSERNVRSLCAWSLNFLQEWNVCEVKQSFGQTNKISIGELKEKLIWDFFFVYTHLFFQMAFFPLINNDITYISHPFNSQSNIMIFSNLQHHIIHVKTLP